VFGGPPSLAVGRARRRRAARCLRLRKVRKEGQEKQKVEEAWPRQAPAGGQLFQSPRRRRRRRRRWPLLQAGVRAISGEARKKGVGARGLRSIMERLLLDAMFHVGRLLLAPLGRRVWVCVCVGFGEGGATFLVPGGKPASLARCTRGARVAPLRARLCARAALARRPAASSTRLRVASSCP
jgi:hypothetical protein